MSNKKARTFDFTKLLGQTIKHAQEKSRDTLEKRKHEEEERQAEKHEAEKPTEKIITPAAKTESTTPDPKPSEEADVGPPIPAGFDVGPAIPAGFVVPNFSKKSDKSDAESDDSSSDDSDEEDDDSNRMTLPISSSIKLQHGTKPISALALDPSGARLLSGGDDYTLKFWDFPGMTQTLEAFRYMEPQDGYHIRDLSYSHTGDNILVVTGSATPMLYDRDGFLVSSCVKGDNYLMDASKTPGHQAMCNAGNFHPFERGWFITVSNDGTLRQWDVESRRKDMFGVVVMQHFDVRKIRSRQGKRAIPTTCTYDRQGKMIATGNDDGSIQIWDCKRTVAPKIRIFNAHKPQPERITSVTYSYDNTMIASRSTDETVKLWDLRMTKQVHSVKEGLPALFDGTEVAFSPNDKLLLTGTSRVNKNDGPGKLVFMSKLGDLETVKEIEVGETSVASLLWHHRLNQIVYGTSDGVASVLFDEKLSHRGAKLCIVKKKRATELTEMNVNMNVVVPFQPKPFREQKPSSKETQFNKIRKNLKLSHAPEPPINPQVAGQLGRLNAPNGTLHKFIAKDIAMRTADDDPTMIRQKILRHAYKAETEGNLINLAYSQTQPVNVLAEHKSLEDEDNAFNQPLWKRMKYTDDKKKGKIVEDEDKLV